MIKTSFYKIIEKIDPHFVLFDASGVLYNDAGVIREVPKAIATLQKQNRKVFIVTNNSHDSLVDIKTKLANHNIHIPVEHIISSAMGLVYDPKIREVISKKRLYIFGYEGSKSYLKLPGIPEHQIVTTPENADCIIFMSSAGINNHDQRLEKTIQALQQDKQKTVICTNPDRYVQTYDLRIPVMGFFVDKVITATGCSVMWMGKPFSCFSTCVKQHIFKETKETLSTATIFFDDNPENVTQIQNDLKIHGCCVQETGLSYNQDLEELLKNKPQKPNFLIEQVGK